MEAMNKNLPNANSVNSYLKKIEAMILRINAATIALEVAEKTNDKIDSRIKQLNYIIDVVGYAGCLEAALKQTRRELSQVPVIISSSLNN